MSEKKKPEIFEQEVYSVWGDKVELLTPYTRCADKVLVRFRECGHECWKNPNKLLAGQGCGVPECHYALLSKNKTRSSEQYLSDLEKKGYHYELLSKFIGIARPIKVRNLKCGHSYTANAGNILQGSGCPVCHGMKTTESFAELVEKKYPGEYTVIGEYVNNRTPIRILHKCGYEWDVIPKDLLRQLRCPNCNKSLGERYIQDFLDAHNLEYVFQYRFSDCRDIRQLPFDFAVFINGKIHLVEFDGTQHFSGKSNYWNNPSRFKKVVEHDNYKNEYCELHNIPLLRIPYWKIRHIDALLASFLGIQL